MQSSATGNSPLTESDAPPALKQLLNVHLQRHCNLMNVPNTRVAFALYNKPNIGAVHLYLLAIR